MLLHALRQQSAAYIFASSRKSGGAEVWSAAAFYGTAARRGAEGREGTSHFFRLRGIAFSLLPFPEGRALFAFQGSAALERRKKNAVRWRGGGADCQNPSASSEGSNPLKFSNVPGGVYDAGTTFCSKKSHFQSENRRGRGACIPVHRLPRKVFLTSKPAVRWRERRV